MRVLLLLTDFPTWTAARHWSYATQFAFEEGFAAHGIDCDIITAPCLPRAAELVNGERYDQVWVEIVHNAGPHPGWYDWVANLAPVRVGLIAESLTNTAADCKVQPRWLTRKRDVHSRVPSFTHVLTVDEADADEITQLGLARALWWPQAVPRRCIVDQLPPADPAQAGFSGSRYGERAQWLRNGPASELVKYRHSPESRTWLPWQFTGATLSARVGNRLASASGISRVNQRYLKQVRRIRRAGFDLWLQGLNATGVVVNLPHIVKAYPGRVVEAMAVGRPVVAWDIPDRPRNHSLFQDGSEILLYSKEPPESLAQCIRRLQAEPDLAARIATAAWIRVREHHTVERRVQQIQQWIAAGEVPDYVRAR